MRTHAPRVKFTLKSANGKVGPIPVSTTDKDSCPDACPLKRNGCYAEFGPLGMLWAALSDAKPDTKYHACRGTHTALSWDSFCDAVEALPADTLWRHNQAGDLPGFGDTIDIIALARLAEANAGKRGFTYTHKPMTQANAAAIRAANAAGFTINLSADNLAEADQLSASNVGPVVVVLPAEVNGNEKIATPQGRRVAVCPATYRDDVSCSTCQLCQRQNRAVIVGFPAHGASKRKASNVAKGS